VAQMWATHYGKLKQAFSEDFGEDLIGAFRRLMDAWRPRNHHPPPPTAICPCWAGTRGPGPGEAGGGHLPPPLRPTPGVLAPECAYSPRYPGPPEDWLGNRWCKGVEEFCRRTASSIFYRLPPPGRGKAIGSTKTGSSLERLWERTAAQYQERPEEEDKPPPGLSGEFGPGE
jgi:hypothetical protein